ncbi:MAG: SET domain-containing protein-lysine N-methyltransferase [Candidatus Acidiferrales bacterium]
MKVMCPQERHVSAQATRYRLEIRASGLHRYGLFALEEIPRRRRVIEYTGKRVSLLEAWKIGPARDIYMVGLNFRWCLDGSSGGSGAEFVNHSCEPNMKCQIVGERLYFVSRRKIRAGEELTWKYRYPVKVKRIPCRCGARRCRGTLRVLLS